MTSNESNTSSSSSSSSTSLFDKFFLMRKNKKNKSSSSDKQQSKLAGIDNNNNNNNNNVLIEKKSSNNATNITQNDINNSNQLLPSFLRNKQNGSNNSDQALVDKSNLNPMFDLTPINEEGDKNVKNMEINSNSAGLNSSLAINDVYHKLVVTNYLSPTYCDYCSQMLIGLIKQGLKCESCGLNFHKRCIPHIPTICNKQLNSIIIKTNNLNMGSNNKNPSFLIDNFDQNATSINKHVEIEHTFLKTQIHNIGNIVLICDHCKLKINNSDKYLLNCKDCHILIHLKCSKNVKKNCKPPQSEEESMIFDMAVTSLPTSIHQPQSSTANFLNLEDSSLVNMNSIQADMETDQTNDNENSAQSRKDDNLSALNNNTLFPNVMTTGPGGGSNRQFRQRDQKQSKKNNQICLQRLSQRVKKTSGYFWSGHMVYYTKEAPKFVTHYWKLDSKSITIYDSYRLERLIQEIPLNVIKKASLCGLNMSNREDFINDQKCLFTLKTDIEVYYCGMGSSDPNVTMNVLARNFYNIFKMVYLPYSSRHGGSRQSLKITAPKYEERNLEDEYLINPQELLGSGQFGQVYGGLCKANNQPVAIKVIDKTRFKDFQAETSVFQNEITILYNVKHPGIVNLFALFDEVDNLYIVTEKLHTDMLEMILNKQPVARLNERIAKFLIYQILVALSKLHDRNIAHCDLKPENILLTENSEFPQVKICDFGYAKIIGENSFRRSMVGTPAYSPPELKQKRVYNNSIDMWSMGVIVYVSLSGTFPFEEDRDIYEQIMNSNFMFPADPWETISTDAVNLINQFLQVKIDRRMSANKALQHPWFSEDLDLYGDLTNLEKRLNHKWLISKDQEEKWIKLTNESIHL